MEIKNPQPPLTNKDFKISGRYYSSTPHQGSTITITLDANKLHAYGFLVSKTESYDRMVIEVSTADAVNTGYRMGIYYNNPLTNLPGTLLLDAGAVSVATTGIKSITISLTLKPGLYWLAYINQSATVGLRKAATSSEEVCQGWVGTSFNAQAQAGGVYNNMAYAALPATFPAITYNEDATVNQCIWLRYL